jgi:hypothetical protein
MQLDQQVYVRVGDRPSDKRQQAHAPVVVTGSTGPPTCSRLVPSRELTGQYALGFRCNPPALRPRYCVQAKILLKLPIRNSYPPFLRSGPP